MPRVIRLAGPLAVLTLASVVSLVSLVACSAHSEDGLGASASAVTQKHVLVVGETPASWVDAAAPTVASSGDAGSEGEPATDDLDDDATTRAIGDGAVLRTRRILSAPGVCILPVGAYDLEAAPTRSDDGLFWKVRFAIAPTGIGGAACGDSGWVEAAAVHFLQNTAADATPSEAGPGACGADPSFRPNYTKPVQGPITGYFGDCRDGCSRRHAGIDIAASTGTPVLAAEDGVVIDTGTGRGACGTVIEVRHPNGASTRFCHNSKLVVRKGDCVRRGQKIAEVGNTGIGSGPHMHLELYPSPTGGAVNPKGIFGY
jgi:murein DD-endopeptidase MepM/ murein hydrolase activator NlpD